MKYKIKKATETQVILHEVPCKNAGEEYEDENDGHLKSYHSDDLSVDSIIHEEEEDAMRGVSNVVYRKE